MAAYVIGHMTVRDEVKWADYRGKVPPTLAACGGEVVLRGRKVAVLNGAHAYDDTVVLAFPDMAAARKWYGSAAYQALIPLREQAADMVLVAYES
jgi:uncharacterized protein (DUF1330 family)